MIKAGIVGGSGYAGLELIRLLQQHKHVELEVVTSRVDKGKSLEQLHPGLLGKTSLKVTNFGDPELSNCHVVFFATPAGVAMSAAPGLLSDGVKIIDLSPDFRLKNLKLWEKWYSGEHASPELVDKAVYGLPEVNRRLIKNAKLIANPGCYATAVQLGFFPSVEKEIIDPSMLIADAKSGISGAGRGLEQSKLFPEVVENFKAYGLAGHRHHPEILQGLSALAPGGGESIGLNFVPHVMPCSRGIFATLYAPLKKTCNLFLEYQSWYSSHPFVEVLTQGVLPETRYVRGTNRCLISATISPNGKHAVILVALDNLVKGAAGQAIQNMNLMFDLPEDSGLGGTCLFL